MRSRANAVLNGVRVDVAVSGDGFAPVRGRALRPRSCTNPPQMPTPPGRERDDADGGRRQRRPRRLGAARPGHRAARPRTSCRAAGSCSRSSRSSASRPRSPSCDAAGLVPRDGRARRRRPFPRIGYERLEHLRALDAKARCRARAARAPSSATSSRHRPGTRTEDPPMKPARLIVNADDFGLTRGRERGHPGRAPARDRDEHDHAREPRRSTPPISSTRARRPRARLGLHVNLTLGRRWRAHARRLARWTRRARSARRARGRPARASRTRRASSSGRRSTRFEKLMRAVPTHLDTHHHVGLHAPVRELVAGRRARASACRCGARTRRCGRGRARLALKTPDHFFGESGPDAYWSSGARSRTCARCRRGVSEFMTHPGWFDDDLAYSRYGRQRDVELRGLGSRTRASLIERAGIRLCTSGTCRRRRAGPARRLVVIGVDVGGTTIAAGLVAARRAGARASAGAHARARPGHRAGRRSASCSTRLCEQARARA